MQKIEHRTTHFFNKTQPMVILYKFKSEKRNDSFDPQASYVFLGTFVQHVMKQRNMQAHLVSLCVTNAESNHVYVDDAEMIPNSSTLLLKRVPLSQEQQQEARRKHQQNKRSLAISYQDVHKSFAELAAQCSNNAVVSEEDKLARLLQQQQLQAVAPKRTHHKQNTKVACSICTAQGKSICTCNAKGVPKFVNSNKHLFLFEEAVKHVRDASANRLFTTVKRQSGLAFTTVCKT